jgi:Uma2 family endonuclease
MLMTDLDAVTQLPSRALKAGLHRFSVEQYHRMIDLGMLTEDENIELLEGLLIYQLPRDPQHCGTQQLVFSALHAVLPSGWLLRNRSAITLTDSEPEPDLAIAKGNARTFLARHPGPSDLALVIEVANTTLDDDRQDKGRIYARAGIMCYWIVNVVDMQIEVYTNPTGPTTAPAYASRQDFRIADTIPLVIDNNVIATIAVRDLLP